MTYYYKLTIDGVVKNEKNSFFKPNIIAEVVKDLDRIDSKSKQTMFQIIKG